MPQGQLFYGSIDLTLLIDEAKKKHSSFTKGNNGHVYASVNVWLNSEKDKYGNIMSIQINPSKEMKHIDKRIYIGNLKENEGPKPVSDRDVSGLDIDFNVSSRQPSTGISGTSPASNITEPIDDLPF